ncbi:DEAD/DEAH box helicase family protein [Methanogenium marinum]|uniref:DEAD/DEAH box helicase family protein n=1 Tax=Methanogenium marinum TaxID=348610 RepID=A0A9Q4PUP6_9EURY|nr:DEAD/DEAH box helicase family protein [Methanogenium marinum]MDE4907135.1 DEAD/DEAH box helicase family protein [Methanogenium marinum]
MTANFSFLTATTATTAKTKTIPLSLTEAANAAENSFPVGPAICTLASRRALEIGVRHIFATENIPSSEYDTLSDCIHNRDFRSLTGNALFTKINYIRKTANNAAHTGDAITPAQAITALANLHAFFVFLAERSGNKTHVPSFSPALIPGNKNPETYTEYETRRAYIDTMLLDAGWEPGKNWINEYEITAMPNKSNCGFADYVLFDTDGKPLAVIEAKKTSIDISKGRQQAVLYADNLEERFGQRPILFLSNGYETKIWDDLHYPERLVSGIYSLRDLQKEFNKNRIKHPLKGIIPDPKITDRYYQIQAVQSVCETIDEKNQRKALLVMATGSGKTRTVISIVDVLTQNNWAKNVLFLTDRTALIIQAKRSFSANLPDLSLCNLVEDKTQANARIIFSTYQTIANAIDDAKTDEGKRLYTPGHFDLIIIDEAHRSIYNKYRDIFSYFDALLIGLTATPKDEIDRNTYQLFNLPSGIPTFGYELSQAVADGYLVPYQTVITNLKYLQNGITYADLSDEEQAQYEDTFTDTDGNLPETIQSSAINTWVFNKDTIRKALHILMNEGIKIESESKIGKTIIFAKSHAHAEKILEVWNEQYPHYPSHYCRIIDNYTNYAQSLIDDLSTPDKFPQIAVSVDMLDTGIDIPEILNLVFFKKVLSKGKFWQMIGRGTRTCKGLIDGNDKTCFSIFDFCSNFAFFNVNANGVSGKFTLPVQSRLFAIRLEIIRALQNIDYQTPELTTFRQQLVTELTEKVNQLNRDNFAVKQHLASVDKFKTPDAFTSLNELDMYEITEHIVPLITPEADEITAVTFDELIYHIECATLTNKPWRKAKRELMKKADRLSNFANIPEIKEKSLLIRKIRDGSYLDDADIHDFEQIRTELRDLMKYLKGDKKIIYTIDLDDEILVHEKTTPYLTGNELRNYRERVEEYLIRHQDTPTIRKLKTNNAIIQTDLDELAHILWEELGSKDEYANEAGDLALGEFIRSIAGIEKDAVNTAFSEYISSANLDFRQIDFVKKIIDYIAINGLMKDKGVLMESPFTDAGSISEIFDMTDIITIRNIIDGINKNAVA